jgi:hypothetical protein
MVDKKQPLFSHLTVLPEGSGNRGKTIKRKRQEEQSRKAWRKKQRQPRKSAEYQAPSLVLQVGEKKLKT